MSNIIIPQNVHEIFGSPWIPDNQILYIKPSFTPQYLNTMVNNEWVRWRWENANTCLKISVRDMRCYHDNFIIAGQILSNNPLKGQISSFKSEDTIFMLNYFNKYFWLIVATTKFKILLRRIRTKINKKSCMTFLLWAKSPCGTFGGMSNFPIRKTVREFVV